MVDHITTYDGETERTVIGIMLIDPIKAQQISNLLSDEDFHTIDYRLIFDVIKYMVKKDKPIDIVTVSDELKFQGQLDKVGGRSEISVIANEVITTANFENYCKTLIKYSRLRQMLNLSMEIRDQATKKIDIDDIIYYTREETERLLMQKANSKATTMIESVSKVMDGIESMFENQYGIQGLPTSLSELDQYLNGLGKSKFYVLGGRPSMGKSALAFQIAEYVSANNHVAYFSLEMNEEEYTQRSLLSKAKINIEKISRKMICKEYAMEKLAEASTQLSDKIHIIDTPTITLRGIENELVKLNNKLRKTDEKIDLIVIDYIQLMGSDDKYERDDFRIISRNSNGLKKLARKYNIPVLGLCQLSRELERRVDKKPILADLRGSGDLEQDADVVIFVHREEKVTPGKDIGMADILIRKQRAGRTGEIRTIFNPETVTFTELPKYN